MASVDVLHNPGRRIEGGVKQSGIETFKRRFVKQPICRCDQGSKIGWDMPHQGPQRGLQRRHHQGGGKTLATDVSKRDAEFAIRKRKEIGEISTHSLRLTTHSTTF